MTTEEQDSATPGEREVDYEDITAGMRFLCAGHSHEILSVKSSGPTKESGGRSFRARKVLRLSCVYGCPRKEWTCQPGDAVICAAEPNTDALDTQPIRASTPIATHRIPARDVVPGMLWPDTPGRLVTAEPRPGETWATITAVDRIRGMVRIMSGSTGGYAEPGAMLYIRLPGPSPRQLCCSCKDRDIVIYQGERDDTATLDPALHAAGCPVAPVTGVHGGMRLWPAPGVYGPWEYLKSEGDGLWCDEITDVHAAWLLDWDQQLEEVVERGRPPRDYVLQCFYLPPVSPPPRRMPGATADDPDLERVADLVSGDVIGPVRR